MPSVSDKQESQYSCIDCGKIRGYSLTKNRPRCRSCYDKFRLEHKQTDKDKIIYMKRWFQENKRRQNNYYETYRDNIKLEIVNAYGGKCLHCGEKDPIVLVIDHIYDDGQDDKKKGLSGGYKLYQWLKRNNFPKDRYQLLCHNCNYRKEFKRRRLDAFRFKEAS